MIGHVPDNEFSPFAREDYFKTDKKYDDATIVKTLRKYRMLLMYWFKHPILGFSSLTGTDIDLRPFFDELH